MDNQISSFHSINIPIITRCLFNDDAKVARVNALSMCSTTTVFKKIIDSPEFFLSFVGLIQSDHPWFKYSKQNENEAKLFMQQYNTFKKKCLGVRNLKFKFLKTFPGEFHAEALLIGKNVELFSFSNGISKYMLKENSDSTSLPIPDSMPKEPFKNYPRYTVDCKKLIPKIAQTEKYLAVNNGCDSIIYIYSADGEQVLSKYDVKEKICKIILKKEYLYVVSAGYDEKLYIYDLASEKFEPINQLNFKSLKENFFGEVSLCIGNQYLVYIEKSKYETTMNALGLSDLTASSTNSGPIKKIYGNFEYFNGSQYIFERDDHFIHVLHSDNFTEIKKLEIKNDRIISKQLATPEIKANCIQLIDLHNDRLFFADVDHKNNKTIISYYDLIKNKYFNGIQINELSPAYCRPFRARFLSNASETHYLSMQSKINIEKASSNDPKPLCVLATIQHGKL